MSVTPMRQHGDFDPELRQVDARLRELDDRMRKLTETSAERIHDFERRIELEWLALRQLHEDQLKDLRHSKPLQANPPDALASHEALIVIGEMRSDLRQVFALLQTLIARRFEAEPVAREPERRVFDSNAGVVILIAAFVALTALGGYTLWRMGTDLRSATTRLASAERQVTELRQQTERQSRAGEEAFQRVASEAMTSAARAERIAAVLASADLREFALIAQKTAPAAAGHALWSRTRGVVLTATRVPAPPSTDVYQFWIDTARGAVSLGFVTTDDQGRVSAAFDTPPSLPGTVAAFLLTLEHAGGGLRPSDAVVLASVR